MFLTEKVLWMIKEVIACIVSKRFLYIYVTNQESILNHLSGTTSSKVIGVIKPAYDPMIGTTPSLSYADFFSKLTIALVLLAEVLTSNTIVFKPSLG